MSSFPDLKYFKENEFSCSHTGKCEMETEFLICLDELRKVCDFPFKLNSAYRDKTHPVEAKKAKAGQHNKGVAVDIAVSNGSQKYQIVKHALEIGFTGIGVAKTFVHVDKRKTTPVIWTY